MPPATTSKAHIAAVDDRELRSPAAASGAAAFNAAIDTQSLADDIRTGRLIPGVDPTVNTIASVPYRQYISRVLDRSGVPVSQIAKQLCSHICGFTAALPAPPSKTEKVGSGASAKTEYDLQVDQMAAAADAQVRGTTGNQAVVLIGPARQIAKAALDLRIEDPDGSKGISWVNAPLPAERAGHEGDRFNTDGTPIGITAEQRERLQRSGVLGEADGTSVGDTSEDLSVDV